MNHIKSPFRLMPNLAKVLWHLPWLGGSYSRGNSATGCQFLITFCGGWTFFNCSKSFKEGLGLKFASTFKFKITKNVGDCVFFPAGQPDQTHPVAGGIVTSSRRSSAGGLVCSQGSWESKIRCLPFCGWWFFKYFSCSPRLFGEDSHFNWYFSKGLKPPTSFGWGKVTGYCRLDEEFFRWIEATN